MYRYDALDKEMLADRVSEFRHQVARRLSGDITEDQFKPLRLMNGLYLQLHAYMLRVAIPYGTLNPAQMRKLGEIARVYDKSYGHFTTRTNLQFHWIKLRDAPDILESLAQVDLHAIQTSGNCIRNVTADPYAGATADEIDDPRVWAEVIRQWSTFHPEFSFLPRKFKIAVTASAKDRTAARTHDIGLSLRRGRDGSLGFEVMVGGGLGRTPYIGPTVKEHLPVGRLLSYLQAILRVYNRHGRRDNKYKARIKILVASLGVAEFGRQVEEEWVQIDPANDLPDLELARVRGYFAPAGLEPRPAVSARLEAAKAADPALSRFVRNNIRPHKAAGYTIVDIALKTPGETPGDASADQMDVVADLAERYSLGEVRVTHEQNLVLPHVRLDDLPDVHAALKAAGLASANANLVSDIIACPGLDYCALANARAIPIAQHIAERFADPDTAENIGELKIKISGCINACGHHHVGHIGILGVDKKGEEFYQLTLGGSGAEDAEVGKILGPAIHANRVTDAIDDLVAVYLRERQPGERFLDTYRRTGLAPFKEAVYADVRRLTPDGAVWADDRFTNVIDGEGVPQGDIIVSLTRFRAEGEALRANGRDVGVRLEASDEVEVLAQDLAGIPVVALAFPKFGDGRAYTSATLLRERYGYGGEVRAVGDVLREQAGFMVRCGFDAFEPSDGSTPEQWTRATHRFRHVYQRAADHRSPAYEERAGATKGNSHGL